ncbi:hypothetical protein M408DRAFT_79282 [Serendipita vermifera MAFF 305830]|uniref:Inositol-pentakisphosphate 2-kinase n=1 Tax=Serendipita vermifera MAFF 305830 TaxID=933852 RepID=A0A0C2WY62_SERVB|nr:hypothetical protein M408DRAFT_79282 [Serendipita vermifera MAFF 305830]
MAQIPASHSPSQTDPSDWKYVSEGGATIVFSYVGPAHPVFTGTVLRIRKVPVQPGADSAVPEGEPDEEEPDDPSIEFQNRITSLVVPLMHLPVMESVRVDREWLAKLSALVQNKRPELRRLKDTIDLGRKKAVIATDLVGGKGLAVEIKPKWAFLPNPTYLSEETKETKLRNCRFCMHAHEKQDSGETVATGYCPLDLFSGDEARVSKTVKDLWDAWVQSGGHINNLKIFVEGVLIQPSQASQLLAPVLGLPADTDINDLLAPFTKALLPLLVETKLLPVIGTLQRTLDAFDIEGLVRLWNLSLTNTGGDPTAVIASNTPQPTMDEWVSFVQEYLSTNAISGYALEDINSPETQKRLRYYMMAYLMSATFKDCSVILRLGSGLGDRITVIDLDPKKIEKLRTWEVQDSKIVRGFKESLQAGKVNIAPCNDAVFRV